MLLNANYLKALIADGVIENAPLDLVNATSLDVTLGSEILVENLDHYDMHTQRFMDLHLVNLRKHDALNSMRIEIPDTGFLLSPGAFILAHTQQVFNLPLHISAEYKLKSSMARIGLEHLNAGWCDPGWHGSCLTLELKNMTRSHGIIIHAGDRIGQVVFFEHEPVSEEDSYAKKGRYNLDRTVSGAKIPLQLSLPVM